MDLITIERVTGLEFEIQVRGHSVVADMSVDDGGQDGGPAPAELFASSLGACVAMMVQNYCDTHGYTDGDVSVSLTLELADDPKRIGAVVIDVELPNGFPEEKQEAVRRVAELCVIQGTLATPPRVDIDFL
ncbi:OsmC family protein [Gemmatimonadota bacterium]